MPPDLQLARDRLHAALRRHSRLMIAYSGGVDSAYLAWESHNVLGDNMLAVLADSPSLPRHELAAAIAFAEAHAIPLQVIHTQEMDRQAYLRNDGQRCFHCKDELFTAMERLRLELGFTTLAYGRNLDDAGDHRPGQQAAANHHAAAPLAEAGLDKATIRALARAAGLSVADKPAAACLASRLEYGRPVTTEALLQIEQAESALHALGHLHVRVRHHGTLARIELDRATLAAGLTLATLNDLTTAVRAAGFTYVTLDTEGYRSGSMNAILPIEALIPANRQRSPEAAALQPYLEGARLQASSETAALSPCFEGAGLQPRHQARPVSGALAPEGTSATGATHAS